MSGDSSTDIINATVLQKLTCDDVPNVREIVYSDVNNDTELNISDITAIQKILVHC